MRAAAGFGIALSMIVGCGPALSDDTVAARSGQETRVGWVGSIKADCSPNPRPTLSPMKVADHGQIKLVPAEVTTNKVASCPNAKVPAVIIFYTSSPNYRGPDAFALSSDGGKTSQTYSVSVQ